MTQPKNQHDPPRQRSGTRSRWLQSFVVASTLLGSACVVDPESESADEGAVVHMMLMRDSSQVPQAAPSGAHLTYFGGPTLTHIEIHPLLWNANTQFLENINALYKAVSNSPLYDLLAQYSEIGRGTAANAIVDRATATQVTDAALRAELNKLFAAGILPLPTANSYYPVHFPPGVTIIAPDGSKSCVAFCGYHGTYVRNGVNVNYGVIPDQGGGCANACGNNPVRVNNLDAVASHLLAGAATNPAVGLATSIGPPLGWYDPKNGEIGDICNGQQGTTVGNDGRTYTIQLEFSNLVNDCVAK